MLILESVNRKLMRHLDNMNGLLIQGQPPRKGIKSHYQDRLEIDSAALPTERSGSVSMSHITDNEEEEETKEEFYFKKTSEKPGVKRIKTKKTAVIRSSIMEISSNDLHELEALVANGELEFAGEVDDEENVSEFGASSQNTEEKAEKLSQLITQSQKLTSPYSSKQQQVSVLDILSRQSS